MESVMSPTPDKTDLYMFPNSQSKQRTMTSDDEDELGVDQELNSLKGGTVDENQLLSECSVCGGPAAAHLHYGAISCYSCRAFFRRGHPKQVRCIFGHGQCKVSRHNRTNCKLCRYNRCLEVGMKPEKVDAYLNKRKERESRLSDSLNSGITGMGDERQLGDMIPNRSPASESMEKKIKERPIDPVTGKPIKRKYTKRKVKNLTDPSTDEVKGNNKFRDVEQGNRFICRTSDDQDQETSPSSKSSCMTGQERPRAPLWHKPMDYAGLPDVKKEERSPSPGFSGNSKSYKENFNLMERSGKSDAPFFPPFASPTHQNYPYQQSMWMNNKQHINSLMFSDPYSQYKTRNQGTINCDLPGSDQNRDKHQSLYPTLCHNTRGDLSPKFRSNICDNSRGDYSSRTGHNQYNDLRSEPYNAWKHSNISHRRSDYPRSTSDSESNPGLTGNLDWTGNYKSASVMQDMYNKEINGKDNSRNNELQRCISDQKLFNDNSSHYEVANRTISSEIMRPNQTSVIRRENSCFRSDQMDFSSLQETSDIKPDIGALDNVRYQGHTRIQDNTSRWEMHDRENKSVVPGEQRENDVKEEGPPTPPQEVIGSPQFPFRQLDEVSSTVINRGSSDSQSSDTFFRPYSSVIIRNNQGSNRKEEEKPKHTIIDFREPNNIPAPVLNPRALLYQNYNKSNIESEQSWHITDDKSDGINENCDIFENLVTDFKGSEDVEKIIESQDLLYDDVPRIMIPKRKNISPFDNFSDSDDEFEEVTNTHSDNDSMSVVPLKKRARMFEVPYATGHAINKNVLPIVKFTELEDFKVFEYVVAIEQYQNRRWEYMCREFPQYKQMAIGIVAYKAKGLKIPFNKAVEKTLFGIGLEFTKNNSTTIYEDMHQLRTDVRGQALNTTYPALYIVMYSIMEGNTKETSWMKQQMKTIHITKENHESLKGMIPPGLEVVSPLSIEDQDRFTSPWACEQADENKFTRTVATLGLLLRDDIQLQALYHMLVMMTPARDKTPQHIQEDPYLQNIQVKLCQQIYRYLEYGTGPKYTKPVTPPASPLRPPFSPPRSPGSSSSVMDMAADLGELNADLKTRLLIGLIDDLHDCADIMQNRSLT